MLETPGEAPKQNYTFETGEAATAAQEKRALEDQAVAKAKETHENAELQELFDKIKPGDQVMFRGGESYYRVESKNPDTLEITAANTDNTYSFGLTKSVDAYAPKPDPSTPAG